MVKSHGLLCVEDIGLSTEYIYRLHCRRFNTNFFPWVRVLTEIADLCFTNINFPRNSIPNLTSFVINPALKSYFRIYSTAILSVLTMLNEVFIFVVFGVVAMRGQDKSDFSFPDMIGEFRNVSTFSTGINIPSDILNKPSGKMLHGFFCRFTTKYT